MVTVTEPLGVNRPLAMQANVKSSVWTESLLSTIPLLQSPLPSVNDASVL